MRLVGEGRSNREIADELGLSIGTIKNHVSQIMYKLDLETGHSWRFMLYGTMWFDSRERTISR